jgi:MFS family permease
VLQQLLQVLLVGMTVGMMRNVVPALAESEFGVPRGSLVLLVTFVVAFGLVKGGMNFLAGRLAEQHGRQKVLLLGWLLAWPIPFMIFFSPNWAWIVVATLLLGANQGLTWSMTQTSVLDLTTPRQRGLVSWVVGSYGITWGVAQLLTGPWSDVVGRHRLNVAGMWLCGLGVALFPMAESVIWWSSTAVLTGLGMAMLYPNLSAAVVDHAAPAWRASAIGIYRFWRDIGYAVGAAGIGMVAFATGNLESSFGFVATSMFMSAAYLAWRGQEPDVGPKQSLHFHGIGVKD